MIAEERGAGAPWRRESQWVCFFAELTLSVKGHFSQHSWVVKSPHIPEVQTGTPAGRQGLTHLGGDDV